ncbi:MAG: DNA sulfur modification protein DndB [Bradyrhizobium sp.]|uniref:DNA sulfur modification protein DndB n=1 Tax=Bradyrhizobium sp. TaxID=376 RepID=UPI001C28548A|nr:DNA sulfur modification protein DndB [Bradyrhizobium sp.]MBU6462928.1 DNA sulfur modification protein DndB [Pseudomonadota bacterium]MDE2068131.1 DNA sulfur modification protein DndB [Bradyrhizobium sp.]MDE2471142.1 DNA sulfur modification protein DndB [Bradyrhizobium sp.]
MPIVVPALADINIPPHVKVTTTDSFESLMSEIGRRSMMGYAGESFFGTAFVQGSRLQFTTAMPIQKMVEVSKTDRSRKKDNVRDVTEHSNRPQESGHAKQVRSYLMNTACTGDKFILPAFTFNYGVGLDDDSPIASLILFASGSDGTNAWPGILLLPQGAKLDTTDGAHRRSQIDEILGSPKVDDDAKEALKRNAVDVKIVFENSRSDSHQDFADCGKAKAIPKSLVATFDVRDLRNQRSRELVMKTPFLSKYVDATASNVNLSSKSRMIWSMSAVRMFIAHIVDHHPDQGLTEAEKTQGAEDFFAALIRHLPQLAALEKARKDPSSEITTGSLRDIKGGDVALRGIGMAIFARAFLQCIEDDIDFEVMAANLARIDWHLLACERSDLPDGPTFGSEVQKNALPTWAHLLVIGESRYRVSSSSVDADMAWDKICNQVLAASGASKTAA